MTHEEAQRLAREKGVSRPLYALARALVTPFMRLWFGLTFDGADRIPREGPVIIAPNHKSFWDSFFIGLATRRHVRFMGKTELFTGPKARLLVGLGAFPVRRGTSDEQALETARIVLRQGGVLALFPEGTRIRDPDALGEPRSGAGRLALETGATIVPAAISGSERLFLGPLPRPRRVRIAFGEPISIDEDVPTREAAREIVADELWPQVEREFGRLRAHRGLIGGALAALGLGAGVVARRRRRPPPRRPWPLSALRSKGRRGRRRGRR
ncbi:MAG: 1-acyl-sn-glycerol-3-phosphate acyltransferase [Solirubrobacteraceae bacterium]|jgi:1-acyl-sn-glycerol-3-phosphate acyltransferase|nr:1-acyl-sn-glycerol-3-phosphate acyltransferase [Solirubrobacteraceae bacterium]